MFQNLYEIKERQENRFFIKLDKDNTIFKVHFEGSPILPGACILEISRELIELITNKIARIEKIKNMKFSSAISPLKNETIVFSIDLKECEDGKTSAAVVVKDFSEEEVFTKIDLIITLND